MAGLERMTTGSAVSVLPYLATQVEHDDLTDSEISTKFSNFFVDKIKRIRSDLDNASDITCSEFSNNVTVQSTLSMLAPVTSEEMRFIIKQLPNKSSSLDPIPTWLLKNVLKSYYL